MEQDHPSRRIDRRTFLISATSVVAAAALLACRRGRYPVSDPDQLLSEVRARIDALSALQDSIELPLSSMQARSLLHTPDQSAILEYRILMLQDPTQRYSIALYSDKFTQSRPMAENRLGVAVLDKQTRVLQHISWGGLTTVSPVLFTHFNPMTDETIRAWEDGYGVTETVIGVDPAFEPSEIDDIRARIESAYVDTELTDKVFQERMRFFHNASVPDDEILP